MFRFLLNLLIIGIFKVDIFPVASFFYFFFLFLFIFTISFFLFSIFFDHCACLLFEYLFLLFLVVSIGSSEIIEILEFRLVFSIHQAMLLVYHMLLATTRVLETTTAEHT